VLEASIKFAVQLPKTTDEASQMPHKFTLTNDDGSYSKTLTLESDAKPGDDDGTCMLLFEDMTENHTYSLQCDNGESQYMLFEDVNYGDLLKLDDDDDDRSPPSSSNPQASSPPAGDPPASSS
jgi:hypothetical protein